MSLRAKMEATAAAARKRKVDETRPHNAVMRQGTGEPARTTRTATNTASSTPTPAGLNPGVRRNSQSPGLQGVTKKRRSDGNPSLPAVLLDDNFDDLDGPTSKGTPPDAIAKHSRRKRFQGSKPGTSVTSPVDPKTQPKFNLHPRSEINPKPEILPKDFQSFPAERTRMEFAIPPQSPDDSPPKGDAVDVDSSGSSAPRVTMPHTPPPAPVPSPASANPRFRPVEEEEVLDGGDPPPKRSVRVPRSKPLASVLQSARADGGRTIAAGTSVNLPRAKPFRSTPMRERLHKKAHEAEEAAEGQSLNPKPAGSSSLVPNLFPESDDVVIDVDGDAAQPPPAPAQPAQRLSDPVDETIDEGDAGSLAPIPAGTFYNSHTSPSKKKDEVARALRHDANSASRPSPKSSTKKTDRGRKPKHAASSSPNGHVVDDDDDGVYQSDPERDALRREKQTKVGDGLKLDMDSLIESFGDMFIVNFGFISWSYSGLCEKTLAELCPKLDDLKKLRQLSLGNNKLRKIPDELKKSCERANVVNFERNRIPDLPAWFYSCANIVQLDLSYNHLTSLSPLVRHMELLELLNISNNQIRELPLGIGKLKKLRILDAKHNKLTKLPDDFGEQNTNVICLDLSFNPRFELSFPDGCANFIGSIQDVFVEDTEAWFDLTKKERKLPAPELVQLLVNEDPAELQEVK